RTDLTDDPRCAPQQQQLQQHLQNYNNNIHHLIAAAQPIIALLMMKRPPCLEEFGLDSRRLRCCSVSGFYLWVILLLGVPCEAR
ncbi:hypothetical protein ACXOKD_09075, partial [Streptococcus thermophilus]